VSLKDDLGFFPQYKAVYLYRLGVPKKAVTALNSIAGTIDEAAMVKLNAEAEKTKDYVAAANLYFKQHKEMGSAPKPQTTSGRSCSPRPGSTWCSLAFPSLSRCCSASRSGLGPPGRGR